MTRSVTLFLAIFLVLSLPTAAFGQFQLTDWYAAPSIVYFDGDPDRKTDEGFTGFQVNAGRYLGDYGAVELALGFSDVDGFYDFDRNGTFERSSESHFDFSANILAFHNRDGAFSPYVMAGIGYLGIDYSQGAAENRATGSLGIGFTYDIGQTNFKIRSELRTRLAYEEDLNQSDYLVNVGVQYNFGDNPENTEPTAASGAPLFTGWYVAPSIVYFDDDPDRKTDVGISGFQINAGRYMWDFAALELSLGLVDLDSYYRVPPLPGFQRGSESHLDFSANILAFYNRDAAFSPFVIAGIGYLGVDYDLAGEENRPSGTLGVGFTYNIGQTNFAVRSEVRARLAYEKDYNFVDYIATVGIQYNFGGSKSIETPENTNIYIDSDGDGVLDIWDECPDTPAGVAVTSRGCPIENLDRDADQDNVFDNYDQCPDTPLGVPVNSVGCSLDSDMDGVTTDQDRCPGSAPGAEVNIYGCANDDDDDGVPNHRDNCPNTPRGARIDVYGCEIKDIITLPGVNFETGFDILLPGTEYILENAARSLNNYPEMQIEVAGHTDNVGSEESNASLSERRAKTVWAYLIRFGVDESRLSFKGYGEVLPIADNATAEGRATNRRVELRLVETETE